MPKKLKCYTKQRKDGSSYTTCNKDIKQNKPKPKPKPPPKPKPKPKSTTTQALQKMPFDIGTKISEEQDKKRGFKIIKKKVLLGDIGTKKGQFIINDDYGTIGVWSSRTGRYFKTKADFMKAEKKQLKEFLKKNPKSSLILDTKNNRYYVTTIEEMKRPGYAPSTQLKVYGYFNKDNIIG